MNKPSIQKIYDFLLKVDTTFKTPLSSKQNLLDLSKKFYEKATVCAIEDFEQILAMVAGYTENLTDGIAYISVVATLPEAQGNGYAKTLINQFKQICEQKKIEAVHLYTDVSNTKAISLYKKLGFSAYIKDDEQRPQDVHLICYLNGVNK